jgi:hypothetical protein
MGKIGGKRRGKNTRSAEEFAKIIVASWRTMVEGVLETGRLLIEAKKELPHGEFEDMIGEKLPFGSRTAQRLMRVAEHPILSNPTHVSLLPPSWGTLYRLAELPDDVLTEMIEDRKLHCEITRKEVDEVHQQVYLLGHYRWVELRDALELLHRFSVRWPNISEIVECLNRDIEVNYLERDDKLVDYSKLNEVSKWIADFGAQCLARVEEKRHLEAEEEKGQEAREREQKKRRANASVARVRAAKERGHSNLRTSVKDVRKSRNFDRAAERPPSRRDDDDLD